MSQSKNQNNNVQDESSENVGNSNPFFSDAFENQKSESYQHHSSYKRNVEKVSST